MNSRNERLSAGDTVRTKTDSAPLYLKTILVPIDFSSLSRKALKYAVGVAQNHHARIIIIHVLEPCLYPENYLGALPTGLEKVNIDLARKAKKQLAELRRIEIDSKTPAEIAVRTGKPFEEIIKAAKETDVELIVIATHGRTGLKHVLLGSTTERVVRHAPCPVLVVRLKEHEFI